MSETVAVALIAGASGFFGALLGAVGAVVGPWWLKRTDRIVEAREGAREVRRAALVEWMDAQVSVTRHAMDATGGPESEEELLVRVERANRAMSEVASRLTAEEEPVAAWLAQLAISAQEIGAGAELDQLSVGSQWLFEWHRGTREVDRLVPFYVVPGDHKGGKVVLGTWFPPAPADPDGVEER